MPNDFHAASGTSRTSANEHQHEQQGTPKVIPLIEIVCSEPGCRYDRHDLKQTVAKGGVETREVLERTA